MFIFFGFIGYSKDNPSNHRLENFQLILFYSHEHLVFICLHIFDNIFFMPTVDSSNPECKCSKMHNFIDTILFFAFSLLLNYLRNILEIEMWQKNYQKLLNRHFVVFLLLNDVIIPSWIYLLNSKNLQSHHKTVKFITTNWKSVE